MDEDLELVQHSGTFINVNTASDWNISLSHDLKLQGTVMS